MKNLTTSICLTLAVLLGGSSHANQNEVTLVCIGMGEVQKLGWSSVPIEGLIIYIGAKNITVSQSDMFQIDGTWKITHASDSMYRFGNEIFVGTLNRYSGALFFSEISQGQTNLVGFANCKSKTKLF
jgi:hypothetical protein